MTAKFVALISVIGLTLVQAQSPAPGESSVASPSPTKHRTHKKAEATASPAATTEASPSPAEKRTRKTKKTTAETSPSPAVTEASPSPAEKRARKGKKTAALSPTVTPSPSPAKKTLADFFKPKSSVSPSPAAAPATAATGSATPAPGGGHGLVWVNTETHVYHKESSRFYGTTKHGKYVSEADAIKEGDRAAAKGR
jgi:hypothetical protein